MRRALLLSLELSASPAGKQAQGSSPEPGGASPAASVLCSCQDTQSLSQASQTEHLLVDIPLARHVIESRNHRIVGNLEREGTHKDHPHRTTQKSAHVYKSIIEIKELFAKA